VFWATAPSPALKPSFRLMLVPKDFRPGETPRNPTLPGKKTFYVMFLRLSVISRPNSGPVSI
jgi:hypothetical protein